MLAAGFLDEVRRLRALPDFRSHPSPLELPALRAVGYRQAWEHLDGLADAATFRDRAIFATRQLAKRQLDLAARRARRALVRSGHAASGAWTAPWDCSLTASGVSGLNVA